MTFLLFIGSYKDDAGGRNVRRVALGLTYHGIPREILRREVLYELTKAVTIRIFSMARATLTFIMGDTIVQRIQALKGEAF